MVTFKDNLVFFSKFCLKKIKLPCHLLKKWFQNYKKFATKKKCYQSNESIIWSVVHQQVEIMTCLNHSFVDIVDDGKIKTRHQHKSFR